MARLNKSGVYRQQSVKGEGNVILVRAELADFWRMWLESPIGNVQKHFLLYPNPYPKKRRFQNRWYAHPAFPMLLQLGGEEIVVRSNWKAFLDDFAMATSLVRQLDHSNALSYDMTQISELDPSNEPWTNFEAKYFNIGETAYELKLRRML
jgi:tRNA (guanine-N7-)-methyltransferase